jgi:hypothetical protein
MNRKKKLKILLKKFLLSLMKLKPNFLKKVKRSKLRRKTKLIQKNLKILLKKFLRRDNIWTLKKS